MSNINEIEEALAVIAFGYLYPNQKPSKNKFMKVLKSEKSKSILKKNVVVLQCTTDYPCMYKDCNLLTINELRTKFRLNTGFSDHTDGIEASIAAVALGACVIEKHITLDKKMRGPDHNASLSPKEFKRMTDSIRNIELALGDGKKKLMNSEKNNLINSRKSLFARKEIKKNDIFNLSNLAIKRPGVGISPTKFWDYIGKKSKKNYKKDTPINE